MIAGLPRRDFRELEENPELTPDAAAHQRYTSNIKWDGELSRGSLAEEEKELNLRIATSEKYAYRPFVATNCYANYIPL